MTDGDETDGAMPGRARRAARDHDALGDPEGGVVPVTSTPFDGRIAVSERDDGHLVFDVTVRVPTLSAVTDDEVASVVEDGWYETFERRIADIGDVTRGDRDLSPETRRTADEAVVEASLSDIDERRGVDDAVAVVDYVEGTYVQGVVPGYEYTDPVTGLIDRARTAGDGD